MLLDIGYKVWVFSREALAPTGGIPRMPHQPVYMAIRLWELDNMESRPATPSASGARQYRKGMTPRGVTSETRRKARVRTFGPVEFEHLHRVETRAIESPRTMLSTTNVELGPIEFEHLG